MHRTLRKQEIVDYWETKPLVIDWADGTDSLLQENNYSLETALHYHNQGYEIYIDGIE